MGFRNGRRRASSSELISFEKAEAYREAGCLDGVLPALDHAMS